MPGDSAGKKDKSSSSRGDRKRSHSRTRTDPKRRVIDYSISPVDKYFNFIFRHFGRINNAYKFV